MDKLVFMNGRKKFKRITASGLIGQVFFAVLVIHVIVFITILPIVILALDVEAGHNHVIGINLIILGSVMVSLGVVVRFMLQIINSFQASVQYRVSIYVLGFYTILSIIEYFIFINIPKYFLDYLSWPIELFLTPNATMQVMFVERVVDNDRLFNHLFTNNIYIFHVIIPITVLGIVYYKIKYKK